MLYIFDADTLITSARFYLIDRFPVYWEWLAHCGEQGDIKVSLEQFNEVTNGDDALSQWLSESDIKSAMLLDEEPDAELLRRVHSDGYAPDLSEDELVTVGKDPFLIAYALADPGGRTVVSFESSHPNKQRANKKVPNVCNHFGVPCVKLNHVLNDLDFTTNWTAP